LWNLSVTVTHSKITTGGTTNGSGRARTPCPPLSTTGVQKTARPAGTRAFGLFARDIENDAKACFAAHHALVRLGGFFQRKNFVHGMHVR